MMAHTRCADEGGVWGKHWWQLFLRECGRKIILAQNSLCQAEAQYQIPFRLLVPQWTGKAIPMDHAGVRPRECDSDHD